MIEVVGLRRSFGEQVVLRDANLRVHDGRTLAIIGKSGSGKSVLLKHIIGLLKPDAGAIRIDGVDLATLDYRTLQDVRRRFGVLFQSGALFDSMNAFENVAFPLRQFTTLSNTEIRRRVNVCLEQVQLRDVGPKQPADLSGGMKKRVALARAIALEPAYILYDEPTSGLDPETSNTIDELINDLARTLHVTSIVVTHDMHSVLTIAQDVAFVHGKTIHWQGTLAEMKASDDPDLNRFIRANAYTLPQTS